MEITQQVKEAWAELVKNNRQAAAELIVEYVQPNHLSNDYMSLLLRTRRLNVGDMLVKKVRKGIRVHTLVPGAVHLASEITTSERINYVLDGADVKVVYDEWELERGDIGTIDEIRREMNAKLRDFYFNKVFTALSTIWNETNTPNNYTDVGGELTATALEDMVDEINYRGGGAKLIVGTQRALQPITKFGAFWDSGTPTAGTPQVAIPSVLEELRQTGWVGRYYGVPVLKINQIWDNPEDYNTLLPEDKVLVIGEQVGEFITFGDVRTKQWTDPNPTPPLWYLELYQMFGLLVDNSQGIGVLEVTPA